jgi:type I restriction enzyme S subunit
MNELPDSWIDCRLGEVVDYGTTRKAEPTEIPADAWVLELEDIEKDTSKVLQRFTFAQRQSRSTKSRFSRGDVLYGKLRPYLNKVVVADQDGYCTTEIVPVVPSQWLEAGYLFYWLKHPTFLNYVTSVSHGLNMPRLGTAAGHDAPFVLAPLNEQKRIADKLDALLARVDACRERLDRVPAILKRFRQSVLAAATSGDLTQEWRDEKGVGAEWFATSIQAIAQIGTGSTPLRSNRTFYSSTGMPWITSAATAKAIVMAADKFVTDAAITAHRLRIYPAGTLLVAMYGEGKTRGQVTELGIAATINQACAAIIVNDDRAKKAFVKLVLQANYLEMRELAEGGNQPNLNLSKIKEFPLRLPSLAEQDEIVRQVDALFAYADRLEARYAAARAQVDRLTPALLAKAFRGELVPQDPKDEPASLLLERIHATRAANVAKPKRPIQNRKEAMAPVTPEAIQSLMYQMPTDHFTFDDLRKQFPADYETLKDLLFTLLADSDSGLKQVFDSSAQAMHFVRTKP